MNKPDIENSKLAEFTGLLLGDGYIGEFESKTGHGSTKTLRRVKITISLNERPFGDYIHSLVRELFDLEVKERIKHSETTLDLRIFSIDLFNFLTKELGLKISPKWERAEIPGAYMESDYEIDVLRGYFDTDGSVVLTDNNGTLYPRLEMKISPSPMQQQFEEILERHGFRFGSYDIGKGKIRIQMNGKKQLKKWMLEVGFRNPKHLAKAEKALK